MSLKIRGLVPNIPSSSGACTQHDLRLMSVKFHNTGYFWPSFIYSPFIGILAWKRGVKELSEFRYIHLKVSYHDENMN